MGRADRMLSLGTDGCRSSTAARTQRESFPLAPVCFVPSGEPYGLQFVHEAGAVWPVVHSVGAWPIAVACHIPR